MGAVERRNILSNVLKDWRFWLNFIAVILITLPMPFVNMTATIVITTEDGERSEIIEQSSQSFYEVYRQFISSGPHPNLNQVIFIHLAVSFFVVLSVWMLVSLWMRLREGDAGGPGAA